MTSLRKGKTDLLHFHSGNIVSCLACCGKTKEDFDYQRKHAGTAQKHLDSNPNHADWNPKWGPLKLCKHFQRR